MPRLILPAAVLALLCAPFLVSSHLDADDDPLPVLRRMDRNADGQLKKCEIPPGAEEFVRQVTRECGYADWHQLDLEQLKLDWKKRPNKDRSPVITHVQIHHPEGAVSPEFATLKYAAQLIRLYDQNDDRILQAHEWLLLGPHWAGTDRNGDEQISLKEMAAELKRLQSESSHQPPQSGSKATQNQSSGRRHSSTAALSHKPVRPTANRRRPRSAKETTRLYASELLRLYDTNRDGVLHKEEWRQLSRDWDSADLNRNGQLSLDEVTVRMHSIQQGRVAQQSQTSSKGDRRPGFSDLPEAFRNLDRDQDGQIQMYEFASEWDDSVVARFLKFDTNQDYLITPQEWLLAEIRDD